MATTVESSVAPYDAYLRRDVPEEDRELTHVGPGTPCGEYLRRFWHPVGLSADLQDLWTGDATRALDFQTEERATTFLKKRNLAEKCSIVELESTETQIFRRNLNRISDPPVRSRQK